MERRAQDATSAAFPMGAGAQRVVSAHVRLSPMAGRPVRYAVLWPSVPNRNHVCQATSYP